jgi:hypothetical protein
MTATKYMPDGYSVTRPHVLHRPPSPVTEPSPRAESAHIARDRFAYSRDPKRTTALARARRKIESG